MKNEHGLCLHREMPVEIANLREELAQAREEIKHLEEKLSFEINARHADKVNLLDSCVDAYGVSRQEAARVLLPELESEADKS